MPKKWETWWAEIKTVQQVKQEPCVQENKTKNSFPSPYGWAGVQHSPWKQSNVRGLGWQTPSLKMFHSYFFFSQICISTMTSYGLEYPLGQPGSAVTLPNSLCTPRILLVGWGEEKRSWLCVSFAQQKWKHPCIINTISSTNPNHSPESAAVKKIDSIPAKSVQCCKYIFDVQKTRFDYFVVP